VSTFTVPQGLDESGVPKEGPGTPANQARLTVPNEKAARAASDGAYPRSLSPIIDARENRGQEASDTPLQSRYGRSVWVRERRRV
jgi:hypothetical protein